MILVLTSMLHYMYFYFSSPLLSPFSLCFSKFVVFWCLNICESFRTKGVVQSHSPPETQKRSPLPWPWAVKTGHLIQVDLGWVGWVRYVNKLDKSHIRIARVQASGAAHPGISVQRLPQSPFPPPLRLSSLARPAHRTLQRPCLFMRV